MGVRETGGRGIGEAARLDRTDVDLDDGVITVGAGKFGRWREVPLQPSTVDALGSYARRRDALCPEPKAPSFFVSNAGTRLIPACVRQRFGRLARTAGLRPRSPRGRPRIHDFRHSFAVATLLGWDRSGADVPARLPLLSAFLGHVAPAATCWYPEAPPRLLAPAAAR